MKKLLIKIGLFLLGIVMVLSPFGIFLLVAHNQKHVYSKTYYAALVDKINYLKSLKNEKKIVLVGGSNVAFGFNSELLEKEFPDYQVVNFGLYAMLGTKIMMDLSIDCINEGDMVFVIPEINSQSTSLYFNAESTLKALEDDMNSVNKLPKDDRDSVIGSYFNFVNDRGKQKEIIEPSGVYQRKNFNKYGDIFYEEKDENGVTYRSANRMPLHYDPTIMVDFSYQIDQSFFDYVNEFNSKITSKKASLYYSFSPVDEGSVQNKDFANEYYWNIRNHLSCKVIGNPSEYIIDPHYFYDSNFHLNDAGSIYRTYLFAKDIYRDIYQISKKPQFEIPEMPKYVEISPSEAEDSETAKYFDFKKLDSGFEIKGIKDIGKTLESVTLPSIYNHEYVLGIGQKAFEGSCLKEIMIPKTYRYFENKSFDDCLSLKKIYLQTTKPGNLVVDYLGGLFENVSSDLKVYVPSIALASFKVDYNWQFYSKYLVGYDYHEEK